MADNQTEKQKVQELTTFKGMEKSLDRESERKIPGMSHGSKN